MTVRLVETNLGRMLLPDTDNAQYYWLSNTGLSVEDGFIEEVISLLDRRPKGVFLDIGASFGSWTLAFAPYVTQIHAFEPQRFVFHLLCGTIALNDLSDKVEPHRVALGRCRSIANLAVLDYTQTGNFGGLSIGDKPFPENEDPPFQIVGEEEVDVFPFREFAGSNPISFIKIDAEGSEYDILLGGLEVIAQFRPLMFIECAHSNTDMQTLGMQIEAMSYLVDTRGPNFLCVPLL